MITVHLAVLLLSLGTFFAVATRASTDIAFLSASALTILVLTLAEGRWGRDEPAVDGANKRTDLIYTLSAPVVPTLVALAVTQLALVASLPLSPLAAWPLGLVCVLGVLLNELGSYAMHRAMHRVPWLYRLHEVHHSSRAMHWLNAQRFHPLDTLLLQLAATAPLIGLGFPPTAIAVAGLVGQTGAFLQHTRVPVHGGFLSRILHTARAHRVHHREAPGPVRNFGGTFLVWDAVFGTYEAPCDVDPVLGPNRAYPTAWTAQLIQPFRKPPAP